MAVQYQSPLSFASYGNSSKGSDFGGSSGSVGNQGRRKSRQSSASGEKTERPKTPWYPDGTPKSLCLSDELEAFAQLMTLSPCEKRRREALFGTVQRLAHQHLPGSNTFIAGCYHQGKSSSQSSFDIVVEKCGTITEEQLSALCVLGSVRYMDTSSAMAFMQVEALNGVITNIKLFRDSADDEKQLLEHLEKWVAEYPTARTVAMVVEHVLAQACRDLVCETKGGLAPVAIMAMAVHTCRRCVSTDSSGEVLQAFLERFASEVDFTKQGISASERYSFHKPPTECGVFITPSGTKGNLAAKCTRIKQIRAHLQSCRIALRQFDPRRDSHTALSTIISHQPLWKRTVHGAPPKAAPATRGGGSSSSIGSNGSLEAVYHVGQAVQVLRTSGQWTTCTISSISDDRYVVQGPGFTKYISFANAGNSLRPAPQAVKKEEAKEARQEDMGNDEECDEQAKGTPQAGHNDPFPFPLLSKKGPRAPWCDVPGVAPLIGNSTSLISARSASLMSGQSGMWSVEDMSFDKASAKDADLDLVALASDLTKLSGDTLGLELDALETPLIP